MALGAVTLSAMAFVTTKANKMFGGVTSGQIKGVGSLGTNASVSSLDAAHFTNQFITNKTVWLVTAGSKTKLGTLLTSAGTTNPVYYH